MANIFTNGTGGGNWVNGATWQGGAAPVYPDMAWVMAGDTIDQVPGGQECFTNDGIITANSGVVHINDAVITTNTGRVATNFGTVSSNSFGAMVTTNEATVTANAGFVHINGSAATVVTNTGTVTNNSGMVGTNSVGALVGTNASGAAVGINDGTISVNWGFVTANTATGLVSFNWGTVVANAGTVYLASMAAVAGGTGIHPTAFSDPAIDNVRDGTAYRFDTASLVGTLSASADVPDSQPYAPGPSGRVLSGRNAGMVIAYNDNFSTPNENVGKKAR